MTAFDTGDSAIDAAASDLMAGLLVPPGGAGPGSGLEFEVAAFHDFSSYLFLLDPVRLRFEPGDAEDPVDDLDGSDIPVGAFIEFDEFAASFQTWVKARVEEFVWVNDVKINEELSGYQIAWEPTLSTQRRVTALASNGAAAFRIGMAPRLFALYKQAADPEGFLAVAQERTAALLSSWLISIRGADGTVPETVLRSIEDVPFWSSRTDQVINAVVGVLGDFTVGGTDAGDGDPLEELPSAYPFEPFAINSVNFGLQLVYRQDWIALGTRAGEIVRTLPLGPKQTEKVTVKAVRKSKATRSTEVSTSIETATESSMATKDSQEVVEEASERYNWHAEASASASFGWGSGSLTAGMGGENASSSRDAKSTLNETMEKTASKLRTDTKIVVSTEVEETSDFTRVSEISNPNDEIAVTYVYSRLQRQYELRTYLSDVSLVVYVGEHVPAPHEVDGAWVRRYDWILSRALLDESFRADLDAVRSGRPSGGIGNDVDASIQSLMDSLSDGIPNYATVAGKVPDFFQNPQQAYERELERSRARTAADRQFFRALNRLRRHIFDNILYYMRAIWSSEDPDQRLMRYGKIRVATNWEFVPTGAPTPDGLPGYYAPAIHDYERDTAPLSEMINPAGPIGYAGNYAAFYLRESTRWSTLLAALGQLRAPYLRLIVEVEAPASAGVTAVAAETRLGPGSYRISAGDAPSGQVTISQHLGAGAFNVVDTRPLTAELRFHGIVVRIDDPAALGQDPIMLRVQMVPHLDDPELKAIRASTPSLPAGLEEAFYDESTVAAMASMFAGVRRSLAGSFVWSDLTDDQKAVLRVRYHDYLLRSRHSRRIVVDTNNVLLSREVDRTPTLEPFKALHRGADVLTAFEELAATRRENERRRRLLDTDRLGDPDIDKLTVVTGSGQTVDLAALDAFGEEPSHDGDSD